MLRVNGVKVPAGRPGDAEKLTVKVTALHCSITDSLSASNWLAVNIPEIFFLNV